MQSQEGTQELRAAKDAGEGLVILCQLTILCE